MYALEDINREYLKARKDLAAGIICQADFDLFENKADQIWDEAIAQAQRDRDAGLISQSELNHEKAQIRWAHEQEI